jgi:hypothetical protein
MAPKKMMPKAVIMSSKILALISQALLAILIMLSLMFPGTINARRSIVALLIDVTNCSRKAYPKTRDVLFTVFIFFPFFNCFVPLFPAVRFLCLQSFS